MLKCPHRTCFSPQGAKTPPILTLRGDESGTALDLLEQIEDYQLAPHGIYAQEAASTSDEPQPVPTEGHELDLLLQFPGPRTFVFYRPNPNGLARPTQLPFVAAAQTSLEDVRQYLYQRWPDLPTSVHWQLIEIDDALLDSPQMQSGAKGILAWSSLDLLAPVGSIIAMVDIQVWDIQTAQLITNLQPRSLRRDTTSTALYGLLQIQDLCANSP